MKCSVDSLCICEKYKIRRANARRIFHSVPGMGNDLVVKVHYGLGSRNR